MSDKIKKVSIIVSKGSLDGVYPAIIMGNGARMEGTVDMFHLTTADFCPQVEKVLTVGEFYEISGGGQIIFT